MKSKFMMVVMVLALCGAARAVETVSLAGEWRFQLDREDAGVAAQWFTRALPDKVQLPGTLSAQGIGDAVTVDTRWIGGIADRSFFTEPEYAEYRKPGNVKLPFWLTPERCYAGAAWFQREIEIPAAWQGQRVVLSLERPHWETRVWVDGQAFGFCNSLATPHDYDLGLLPPGKHTLTLRVDNRLIVDVGANSHSVSDHTQGNWNGIAGKLELRATPPVWIEEVVLVPDFAKKWLRGKVVLGNATGQSGHGQIEWGVKLPGQGATSFSGKTGLGWGAGPRTESTIICPFGDVRWDEFAPKLFEFEVVITTGPGSTDTWRQRTGVREFTANGTQFAINGRPLFIRGTLDCCIFPKTGHPPVDVTEWKRIIGVAKAHGLNSIRFHSWCPPEAAFVAADEMGFYLHVEASSWANQSTTIGDGKPVDKWIYEETDRILKYYGNHPSFILMPYGNEPGGKGHKAYLAQWVNHYKALDPRRLWTSGAGWPELPENQWHCVPGPRIQAWGGGLKSIINAQPPQTRFDFRDYIQKRAVPVVSHEIGQWCVYPNFDEMAKYTGYLKPRNFEIFRDRLAARGLAGQARQFLLASGKLQALCYKADIEAALRTPGMAGFQLLDLHDFPGQGSALVGVLDPFWEEKGYITAAEYKRFCNATVPLARLSKRVFTTAEKLEADLEVAHFGAAPLENSAVTCSLVDEVGKSVFKQKLTPSKSLPLGNCIALGKLAIELKDVPAPARYKLVVEIRTAGAAFSNDWDVWVYLPSVATEPAAGITVAEELDDAALAALRSGGKVLLLVPPQRVRNSAKDKVVLGFSSIFWNTAWTRRQPPTTLGILCDPKHPALAAFPTDYHSNWQWWYLVTRAAPLILDDLPRELQPTVQVIDDWFTAHKLALAFECKLGGGKLLVSSMDLKSGLEANPVARQMRASLLTYMAGPDFKPTVELTAADCATLIAPPPTSQLAKLGAKVVRVDSEDSAHGHVAANMLDGDPATFWHTAWGDKVPPMPHHLALDLGREVTVKGLTYLPRQDMRNGRIASAEIFAGNDPKKWGTPVAKVTWSDSSDLQTLQFAQPVKARYLKLVALSEIRGQAFAALAELDIILGE
jgi:hypothetical protein